jgi:chorismate mutase-like protein
MEILKESRAQIDVIDEQIVNLLVTRYDIVKQVASIKIEHNLQAVQSDRVEQVKNRVEKMATEKGLDGALLRAIYTLIIDHAHVIEHELIEKGKS